MKGQSYYDDAYMTVPGTVLHTVSPADGRQWAKTGLMRDASALHYQKFSAEISKNDFGCAHTGQASGAFVPTTM